MDDKPHVWWANELTAGLGCTEPVTRDLAVIAMQDISLFDKKQRDYGFLNIALSGEAGLVVRTQDKLSRLRNLAGKAGANESIADSWADLSVYGMIARLVRAGAWPTAASAVEQAIAAEARAIMAKLPVHPENEHIAPIIQRLVARSWRE